jgi:hypothetical protein
MSIQYDGKSPGKLWYFWQNTKAMLKTPFQYQTEKDAKVAGKHVGKFAGIAIATSVVISVPIIAALPIVPMLVSLAGFSWAIHHGWQGVQKIRMLKSSSYVHGYVRDQENKWLHRKADGNVFKRTWKSLKEKVSGISAKIPLPVVKAGKWLGLAAAAVGAAGAAALGLSYAGLPLFSTGSTAAAELGGIAQAGAVVGLSAAAAVATVTGLAIAAIPVGLAINAWCRKTAYARDPARSLFKKPAAKPKADGPIDQGVVFSPKAASFDFNDNAPGQSESLSEERKNAAEARAQNRKRGGRDNRFT